MAEVHGRRIPWMVFTLKIDPTSMAPLFPALAIFFTVLAFNLLGDGLRDALDPKIDRK